MAELQEFGFLGLFIAGFLAATIVPFSSEVVFTALFAAGFDLTISILVVSAGNWLGALTGYGLGYAGNWQKITKFTGVKQEKVEKFRTHVIKYGPLLAFFTWLPGIGDPITVALGFFRTHFWSTALIILLGKVSRYIVFGLMIKGAIDANIFSFFN